MAFPKPTKLTVGTLLLLFGAQGSLAQQREKTAPVSFESASVKLSSSEGRCAPNRSVGQTFTVTNCPLGELILFAYDVLQQQVSGQASLLEDKYEVTAKAEHPVSRSEVKRMLQTLLKDRFKLTLRRETREIPVYAPVVARAGPKISEDCRVQLLSLTRSGSNMLPQLAEIANHHDREFFDGLEADERATLRRPLGKLAWFHRIKDVPIE